MIHLIWVGLLLVCSICPHTTLLGFLPASWLRDTVSRGVCTAGNLHITQIIIWCSKRVSFFSFKAALSCLSTHLEFFVLVVILCHFLIHVHLKIEITLLSLDFRKFYHLFAPIVWDQDWQTNLWKPQFLLGSLHVWCTRHNFHRHRSSPKPEFLLPDELFFLLQDTLVCLLPCLWYIPHTHAWQTHGYEWN